MKKLQKRPGEQKKNYAALKIRVSRDMKQKLQVAANDGQKSLSQQLLFFIEKGVNHQK